jgi:hypothetical protein
MLDAGIRILTESWSFQNFIARMRDFYRVRIFLNKTSVQDPASSIYFVVRRLCLIRFSTAMDAILILSDLSFES